MRATAGQPPANRDVEESGQQTAEETDEEDEADGAVDADVADDFVGFGQAALRVVTGGHRQQPHGESTARADHQDARGGTGRGRQRDPPEAPERGGADPPVGRPGRRRGRDRRPPHGEGQAAGQHQSANQNHSHRTPPQRPQYPRAEQPLLGWSFVGVRVSELVATAHEEGELAVRFEHGTVDVAQIGDAVLTRFGEKVLQGEPFDCEVFRERLPVARNDDGAPFEHLSGTGPSERRVREREDPQSDRSDAEQRTGDGEVLLGHTLLYEVADRDEQEQLEGAELCELTLADSARSRARAQGR